VSQNAPRPVKFQVHVCCTRADDGIYAETWEEKLQNFTIDPITRIQNLQVLLSNTLQNLKERDQIRRDLEFLDLAQRTK
jgi:hypothetical protein